MLKKGSFMYAHVNLVNEHFS